MDEVSNARIFIVVFGVVVPSVPERKSASCPPGPGPPEIVGRSSSVCEETRGKPDAPGEELRAAAFPAIAIREPVVDNRTS
jgi:hypothetical protein